MQPTLPFDYSPDSQVEKIIIKNFGGIYDITLDLKLINILIGPQASGKSMTVKLVYFFKSFFNEALRSIDNNETKRELDNGQIEKFINYFPKDTWPKGPFRIDYQINNSFITIERETNFSLKLYYSQSIKNTLNKCRKIVKDELKKSDYDPKFFSKGYKPYRAKFYNYLQEELGNNFTQTQLFIPAGRSFFANIQSSIFSFLKDNRSLDPFLVEFGSFYESLRRTYNARIEKRPDRNDISFNKLVASILNGDYTREKEKDFLVHTDSRRVNLLNASSGQQETLPLIIVLTAIRHINFVGGTTLYIEEPEAHLFPTAQKRIVQLLAKTFNKSNDRLQIIVTTHSPYILSSFNNLIEAGRIKQEKPELNNLLHQVVTEDEILSPETFTAFSINDGMKTDLIDNDTKLISANILDAVSNEISIQFEKLLDIEF